ncbi:hypothetical protein [Roseivirga sp. E12]|uniref:hypothetical protein n=1 Tax=Roseivirga sp. E12 TaxID=2819237 RepID=UPI001ABCBE1C|nr:hypothetical protein [Roseivirga sp. E12]MBO3699159.1 hypothetical protein [Roseivirga sp. E12]
MDTTLVAHEEWSTLRKIGFRFIFIFFLLFILPFPFSTPLNVFNEFWLDTQFGNFWTWATELFGTKLLGLEEFSGAPTGSGDMTFNWVQYGLFLSLGAIGTIIWSAIDKKRKNYYRPWRWFVLITVYYLVFYMLLYGFIKVFWLQMPELRIDRLLRTYGQSSPMGLLWTFMGASKTYSMYAGLSEVIAGTLLIFRRTRTLGGLVTFGVMFNVFMLNMAYDVPVKLFSAQLMFMGLYIAMIDRKAIFGLLLFQKPGKIAPWPPMFETPWKKYTLLVIQVLLIFYFFQSQISRDLKSRKQYGELRPKSALFGLYDVIDFVQNGDTLPPLLTDDDRWQRVIFDAPTRAITMYMDDRMRYYTSEIDTVNMTVTYSIGRDSLRKDYPFSYEKIEDGLKLSGILEQDTLQMRLKTYDLKNLYLTNRGFHWLNEVPWHRYDPNPKPNW